MANQLDIDFFTSSTPYELKIMDLSNWALIEGQPSIIEINLPGYSGKITKYWDKYKTNIFNSKTLEINCAAPCDDPDKLTLPDGIYTLKVIGSPSTFFKQHYYLKTDLFDMEVDKIYIDSRKCRNKKDLQNKLTEIEFIMRSAKAHLRFQDITTAGMLFEQAQSMVDDLKNCKSCYSCDD